MKIVADEKLPLMDYFFGSVGDIILKNGRDIHNKDLQNADLLLIRSVTHVDKALLQGTSVKFVGSAASGSDHVDVNYLKTQGIAYAFAYGCNRDAVVEYVIACLAYLQKANLLPNKPLRAGVIGVGQIGKKVAEFFQLFNFEVVLCDPIRKEQEASFPHTDLTDLTDLDVISLHTPLTTVGPFPTYHLLEKKFFQKQKKGCVLINSARGEVIHYHDWLLWGQHMMLCADVWENEPFVDFDILKRTLLATSHIAGHSLQSKIRAVKMIYDKALQNILPEKKLTLEFPKQTMSFAKAFSWQDVVLQIFDPKAYTEKFKKIMLEVGVKGFDQLRNQFTKSEFAYVIPKDLVIDNREKAFLKKLGFAV